jgi:PIN domain nuclease of toxin-antitoxin system
MKQLLDTHSFLWFVSGKQELSEKAKSQILNLYAQNFVSIASMCVISIN